jgi:hypothetical protein
MRLSQENRGIHCQFRSDGTAIPVNLQILDNDLSVLFFDGRVINQTEPSVEFGVSLMPLAVERIAIVYNYRVVLFQELRQDIQHSISKPDVQAHGWFVRFDEEVTDFRYFGVIGEKSGIFGYVYGDDDILRRRKPVASSKSQVGVNISEI